MYPNTSLARHASLCFFILGMFLSICYSSVLALTPPENAKVLKYTHTFNGLQDSKSHPDSLEFNIPFTYSPPSRPLITVQIRINQSQPLPFVVDTGWETTLFILPWAAQEMKVTTTGEEKRFQPGNIPVHATGLCNVEIIAQQPSPNVIFQVQQGWVGEVSALQNYPGPRVAGIIGGELFRALISRFDFDSNTLTLFHASHPAITPSNSSTVLPLETVQNSVVPHISLSPPNIGAVEFVVDTGNTSTTLPDTLLPKLVVVASTKRNFANVAETRQVNAVLLPELRIGTRMEPLIPILLLPPSSQALLGLDVLSRFRVTLDPKGKQLILEPRQKHLLQLPGSLGIQLVMRNGETYIDKVLSSDLIKQGIKEGDRLLSIDGQETKGMNIQEAISILYGIEGTSALLVLKKADGTQTSLSITRNSMFESLIRSRVGFVLVKEKNQTARIVYIAPGSEAERQGLKAGYEVIAVNGASLRDATIESLQELFATDAQGGTRIKTMQVVHKSGETAVSVDFSPGKPLTPGN